MKRFNHGIKWTLAAILIAGVTAAPVMAEKTTPATGKNSAVPAVPRAIPDLIPYHKFDPPKSKLFDMSKLTISGDLRVRPEFRNNGSFGTRGKNNTFIVQQWARLGFNYSISPDVTFFFQAQHSKNWGVDRERISTDAGTGMRGNATDANGTNGTIYARQAFMLVRNFMVPNLTVKAGRQLVVWGNHRMFGHFDWNNVGWTHDGLTANYKLSKTANLQCGMVADGGRANCKRIRHIRELHWCPPSSHSRQASKSNVGTDDADIVYVRAPMKIAGLVLEPTYIWHSGGTGGAGATVGPRPSDQSRHTLGGRAVKKFNAGSARVDATMEGYYQFGEIANMQYNRVGRLQLAGVWISRPMPSISTAGLTLPVPMAPRLSAEYNTASGEVAGDGKFGGFDQMYPTNHIHFGYMDRMSWKNMNHYAFGLQMRPNARTATSK